MGLEKPKQKQEPQDEASIKPIELQTFDLETEVTGIKEEITDANGKKKKELKKLPEAITVKFSIQAAKTIEDEIQRLGREVVEGIYFAAFKNMARNPVRLKKADGKSDEEIRETMLKWRPSAPADETAKVAKATNTLADILAKLPPEQRAAALAELSKKVA